jgi:branched-subunit amino acid transport protein
MIFYKGKNPGEFLKSFLEYIPYAALGGLLFPEILYSTGSILVSVIGAIFAGILIIKKQNMIVTVLGTIFLVYLLNQYF